MDRAANVWPSGRLVAGRLASARHRSCTWRWVCIGKCHRPGRPDGYRLDVRLRVYPSVYAAVQTLFSWPFGVPPWLYFFAMYLFGGSFDLCWWES